jgi:predicted RecA/RadA family phage recombinase
MTFTAPSGGVTAGTPVLIGGLLVVPQDTVAQTLPFEGMVVGVHTLTKTSAQAWTEGQKVYWNTGTSKVDSDSASGPLIGVAVVVADNPSATGVVRLNGTTSAYSEGQQPVIAALVDNSGGVAVDGTIAAVSSSATAADAVKELATTLNLVIAALKAAGIVASA